MYIEIFLFWCFWDNVIFEYFVLSNDVGKLFCLLFYYYMYGDIVYIFNVFNGGMKVFMKLGD